MPIAREAIISLLKQVDFDPSVLDTLSRNASEVSAVLEEVARGDAPDADNYMRKNAIAMLGVVGDERSVDTLASLLDHERIEFRTNAMRSLGNISSPRAARALEVKLSDNTLPPTEGKIVVSSLAKVGGPESAKVVEAFQKQFQEKRRESPGLERDLGMFKRVVDRLEGKPSPVRDRHTDHDH